MFEDISVESLRAAGSVKWSAFPGTFGLFIAEMDFGTPPVVAETISNSLNALGYLPDKDRERLAAVTAARLESRYGWRIDPAHVLAVPDVLSALRMTIMHLSTGPIVVPTPAYMPFLSMTTFGRPLIQVPSPIIDGRYELDLDAIDEALEPGALFVLCNPWNPVGRVLTRRELTALAEVVDRNGARVFSDEIHAPLVFDGEHVPYASISAAATEHTVTAMSTSKGWNVPGLKCAQMILPETMRDEFAPFIKDATDPTGILGARAAIALYEDDGGWLEDVLPILDTNRRLVTDRLTEAGLTTFCPEGTYISWIDTSSLGWTDPAAVFREGGCALTPGFASGIGYENHVRLIFASPTPIIADALDTMIATIKHR